ncbi:hypothetical protein ACSHXN_44275 (plasmid) [Streptomyces sp. HUAS TT11]
MAWLATTPRSSPGCCGPAITELSAATAPPRAPVNEVLCADNGD